MFKVIIVGGKNFGDYNAFEKKCISCLRNKAKEGHGIMIYTTGDEFNDRFAHRFGIDLRLFNANFTKHGSNALAERNKLMLFDANAAIIFDDDLTDTKFLIDQVKNKGIPLRIIKKQ